MLFSCSSEANKEKSVADRAEALSKELIIIDGHVDLPYRMKVARFRLEKEYVDVTQDTNGDFDLVKAKKGGLDAPFMSIYIPATYQETGGAKQLADSLINLVRNIAEQHPNEFALANSPEEIRTNFEKGLISLPMGMENGAPIEDSLENVRYFYDRGIRYITLTHSKPNQISDSSYDSTRVWNGLSPFGEQVVQEMNRVGIMVDVSHISDSAFYDVMRVARAPVIASHSSCRRFVPGFERNMNDDMIKRLADNGGVMLINFGSTFVDSASAEKTKELRAHIDQWLADNELTEEDSAAQAYIEEYTRQNPAYSSVQKVADHIDHVVAIAGVDYVGFGSDFDGVGDTLPTGLKTAADYPNLIAELLKRGYSEEDIAKICYQNMFRVWHAVQQVAQQAGSYQTYARTTQ